MFGLGFVLMSLVTACGQGGDIPPKYLGPDGSSPTGLILGNDDNFYGTTSSGGQFNQGTVFRITPDGAETVLYSFAGGDFDGTSPTGNLIQGSDGNFYGATSGGGTGQCPGVEPVGYNGPPPACGILFKLSPDGTETVLHFFSGGTDGGQPTGSLVQGADGNFYGTTSYGSGTVFKITSQGKKTVLHSFQSYANDGSIPSSLIVGSDGNFYGTTGIGGNFDYGTVFRITDAGAETVLHSFSGGADGELPSASLTEGNDGSFYGTAPFGGSSGAGIIFRITPGGDEAVLYSFPGGTRNGANPYTPLIQGLDGRFYGAAQAGGNDDNNPCGGGCGALFAVTSTGTETVLYLFSAITTNGAIPIGNLVQGSDGNFYGIASQGGQFGGGIVFRVTPAGILTVLHSFAGPQSDEQP
jgi:uncharacterized repeat protein (TIGR03803 family)